MQKYTELAFRPMKSSTLEFLTDTSSPGVGVIVKPDRLVQRLETPAKCQSFLCCFGKQLKFNCLEGAWPVRILHRRYL